MTRNNTRHLKVLIETVIERHLRVAAAIDELTRALDDEIEARVADRLADLRQQLEQGDK
jgi:ABC-type dipeptide/oligopeptide/nickel transport system ATPase component